MKTGFPHSCRKLRLRALFKGSSVHRAQGVTESRSESWKSKLDPESLNLLSTHFPQVTRILLSGFRFTPSVRFIPNSYGVFRILFGKTLHPILALSDMFKLFLLYWANRMFFTFFLSNIFFQLLWTVKYQSFKIAE